MDREQAEREFDKRQAELLAEVLSLQASGQLGRAKEVRKSWSVRNKNRDYFVELETDAGMEATRRQLFQEAYV